MKKIESLYIHFPFCRHLCNYCDFFKSVPSDLDLAKSKFQQTFLEMHKKHQKLLTEHDFELSEIETLYIGGGTPSLWGEEGAIFLHKYMQENNISFKSNYEFTLEVNPGSWTTSGLKKWREMALVNRYSLGIQSLNSSMLKLLDRVHSLDDVYETLDFFKKNQFNYSIDFMLGLPKSEELKRNVIQELEEVLSYDPKHISLYILTTKSNYIHKAELPSEEWIEKEYLEVASFLKSNGFEHYEVSNFCKPGFQSRHNLNYWKSENVAALGASATGFLAEKNIRYKWKSQQIDYDIENLNEDEARLEKVYMRLRTSLGLELDEFHHPQLKEIITNWQALDYLQYRDDKVIKLSSKGFLMLDSLLNDFFVHKIL